MITLIHWPLLSCLTTLFFQFRIHYPQSLSSPSLSQVRSQTNTRIREMDGLSGCLCHLDENTLVSHTGYPFQQLRKSTRKAGPYDKSACPDEIFGTDWSWVFFHLHKNKLEGGGWRIVSPLFGLHSQILSSGNISTRTLFSLLLLAPLHRSVVTVFPSIRPLCTSLHSCRVCHSCSCFPTLSASCQLRNS